MFYDWTGLHWPTERELGKLCSECVRILLTRTEGRTNNRRVCTQGFRAALFPRLLSGARSRM